MMKTMLGRFDIVVAYYLAALFNHCSRQNYCVPE